MIYPRREDMLRTAWERKQWRFVYFARERGTGLIKIGLSTNARRRTRDLKCRLLAVVPGCNRLENAIHHLFRPHRAPGRGREYYPPHPDIVGLMKFARRGGDVARLFADLEVMSEYRVADMSDLLKHFLQIARRKGWTVRTFPNRPAIHRRKHGEKSSRSKKASGTKSKTRKGRKGS